MTAIDTAYDQCPADVEPGARQLKHAEILAECWVVTQEGRLGAHQIAEDWRRLNHNVSTTSAIMRWGLATVIVGRAGMLPTGNHVWHVVWFLGEWA